MFVPKRPDSNASRKELERNVTYFALAVLAIRCSTYLMSALQK